MKGLGSRRFLSLAVICAIVLACLIASAPAAPADDTVCPDFFWQNPLPQGNALLEIDAVDTNTAWAVGNYGAIMKTTNGGATWQRQVSGTNSVLHSIDALDANTAWVCGEDNTVLRTVDGGLTWTPLYPDVPGDFNGVSAVNDQVAWVVGVNSLIAVIEKTTDGGQNWTDQSPWERGVADVSAVDTNVAWAVTGGGTSYSTTDGGDNWNSVDSPVGNHHNRLQAFSATRLYAVTDDGHFVKTTNGVNFTATTVVPGFDLKDLMFIND